MNGWYICDILHYTALKYKFLIWCWVKWMNSFFSKQDQERLHRILQKYERKKTVSANNLYYCISDIFFPLNIQKIFFSLKQNEMGIYTCIVAFNTQPVLKTSSFTYDRFFLFLISTWYNFEMEKIASKKKKQSRND